MQKRGKDKKKSVPVSPVFIVEYFMLKSNVDTPIELDTIMCTTNKKVWTLGWVNLGNDFLK
jgi:hypothetical protein